MAGPRILMIMHSTRRWNLMSGSVAVTELSGRSVSYAYFNNYRLQSETIASDPGGNNGQESYTYDAVGNRKTLSSTIPSLSGSNSIPACITVCAGG